MRVRPDALARYRGHHGDLQPRLRRHAARVALPDQVRTASPANFIDIREQSSSFEALSAISFGFVNVMGGGEPERLPGLVVAPNFFGVLGVGAIHGRTFLPEGEPVSQPTVVLDEGLWLRRFGGDPALVGQAISLDGVSHTVVGIVSSAVRSGLGPPFDGTEVWTRALRGIRAPDFCDRAGRRLPHVARVDVHVRSRAPHICGHARSRAR